MRATHTIEVTTVEHNGWALYEAYIRPVDSTRIYTGNGVTAGIAIAAAAGAMDREESH